MVKADKRIEWETFGKMPSLEIGPKVPTNCEECGGPLEIHYTKEGIPYGYTCHSCVFSRLKDYERG